jgi:hypothetical protein
MGLPFAASWEADSDAQYEARSTIYDVTRLPSFLKEAMMAVESGGTDR